MLVDRVVTLQLSVLHSHDGFVVYVQGVMNHDLTLEAEDIAEAALLPLRTTALCVPKEITLDTTQIPG